MSKNLKKKFVIVDNSIAYTGAFHCALQQAKILKDDYEFAFVLSQRSNLKKIVEQNNFRCYQLPFLEISRSIKNLLYYFPVLLKNGKRLLKILNEEKADVLQVNDFYNLVGAKAKRLGFQGKLLTYVRLLPSARPKLLSNWWIRKAKKKSDAVICVSDAVLKEIQPAKNTFRIYDTVEFPEKYDPIKKETEFINLLYLSNYIPGKGLNYALEAFALAYKEQTDLRLKFFGGDMGLEKNRKYKQGLIKKAEESGIKTMVHFNEFTSETEKIIKESDIVLNFSEAESFSMTCAEASYYGRPVIATKCGGPEEIIEDNYSGLLVENRNADEMKEAILKLSRDKDLREEMGKAGKKLVREKFTEETFKKEFSKVLEEVLS